MISKVENRDCMEYMKSIVSNTFDLTITSPPYNLGKEHHTGDNKFVAYDDFVDDLPEYEYQEQQTNVLNEIYRVTKIGGSIMYNHKNRIKDGIQISPYKWIFKTEWTIKQEIVWFNGSQNFDKCRFYPMTERIFWLSKGVKTGFVNTINQHDLIKDTAEGTKNDHKRAFPFILADRLILCFPNAMDIFDPYSGSGTTRMAAYLNKKNFIGCEISKKSFHAGEKRFQNYVSQTVIEF